MPREITIKVPASTSNLGPGFDVLGASLSLYLHLTATVLQSGEETVISYSGNNAHTVPLTVAQNLITQTASYIAAATRGVPLPPLKLHIENHIPLARGLGSSGSAVVAGVLLANEACELGMSRERVLDFCLMLEGHPDNVTASLLGGFCASYLAVGVEEEYKKVHALTPDDYCLSGETNGNTHHRLDLPLPPIEGLGRHVKLNVSPSIRVVVVIPHFELSTKLARKVLPTTYAREDVVFNLQRLSVLTTALCSPTPSPDLIWGAMHDRIHQHYRQHLVPGLPQILALTPSDCPGLLGVCVSGAGPTVLALATENFQQIGDKIKQIWKGSQGADGKSIESEVLVLDFVTEGAVWKAVTTSA
ncbi:ribosomal protein S5 domain 2-type protein [Fimicolochytrium jonesii]|uniref:ribosomal protein S5 domain 2-type protein n=1 Tax=Fimicolochytrium jonesii TaxID=1396493 RepID=UPI0022FEFE71|nr:ribosomal protein S5 domain 2-type protein [Fimicolochytrium jonesii]KAI8815836.1 ribosomal protein S5 domain 2-type protein [Fimicolochytrium jonesii]